MNIIQVKDYINKIVEKNFFKVGIYADLNNSEKHRILINENEIFSIASLFKLPVLIEAIKRIDKEEIELTERLELMEYHKNPGGIITFFDAGTKITINNLLFFMIKYSDNTATDIIGEFLGWEKILLTAIEEGLNATSFIMPSKLMMMNTSNLWSQLKDKSVSERIYFWNSLDCKSKQKFIIDNYNQLKFTSIEEISKSFNEYFNSLTHINQKVLSQAFEWKGKPIEYGNCIRNLLQGKLVNSNVSEKVKEFLIKGGKGLIGKKLSTNDEIICDNETIGRKGGSDEGVRCEAGFIETGKGQKISIVIFTEECTHYDSDVLMEKSEELISDISSLIYNYYLSILQ